MKRDMDLIREILLEVEKEGKHAAAFRMEIEGYSNNELSYHLRLMIDSGLIKGKVNGYGENDISTLTMEGHDFLDAARNQNVWEKTKQIVKEKGGSASLDIIIGLLKKVGREHFSLEL